MPSRNSRRLPIILMLGALSACAGGGVEVGVGAGAPPAPQPQQPAQPVQATTSVDPYNLAAWNVGGSGQASTIGAPVAASEGPNSAVNPTACCGTATGTEFALLQSAMRVTPGAISADAATNSGGATITVANAGTGHYQLTIPSLGIDYFFQSSTLPAHQNLRIVPPSGDTVRLITDGLAYVQFGAWSVHSGNLADLKAFAFFTTGIATFPTAMPTTGTARFQPSVGAVTLGVVSVPAGSGYTSAMLSGLGTVDANFSTGTVTGTFTNMHAMDGHNVVTPWNDVSVTATITSTTFSGSTAATSVPDAPFALKGTATGRVDGRFYGPAGSDVGAVWTLSDGTGSAVGVFAGSQIPQSGGGISQGVGGGLISNVP